MNRFLILLLLCMSITSCFADSNLSVTAQVNTASGITSYLYTLKNGATTLINSSDFSVFMPESAARAVISFACTESVVQSYHSFAGDYSVWSVHVVLAPDESKTYILTTPASVPTSYTFKPPLYPGNWEWQSHDFNVFGNSLIPVPVPEPSSILALAAGIFGLGGFMLRRKR